MPTTVGALRFDAHTDYLKLSTVPSSGGDFSVCCWAKLVVDRNDYSCVWAFEDTIGGNYIELVTDFNGETMAVFDNGGADAVTTMAAGTWYFFGAKVGAAGALTTYWGVEGAGSLTKQTGTVVSGGTFNQFWIGSTAYSEFLSGDIAQFRAWNAQLSDAEFDAEFKSPTLVRTSNVCGWWKLEANATRTTDASGNGNTLTESGSGSWTEVTGPTIGNPATFAVTRGVSLVAPKYPVGRTDILTYGANLIDGLSPVSAIKFFLSPAYSTLDFPGQTWGGTYTTLAQIVADTAFSTAISPFSTVVLNCWTFANGTNNPWVNAITPTSLANEYSEIKALADYLLANYSNKTFVIQNWEGDWSLLGSFDPAAPIPPYRAQRMAAFERERARAVRDSRATNTGTSKIFHAIEVNRALDKYGTRVTRDVLPLVTPDYVSLSAYEAVNAFVGQPNQTAAENAIDAALRAVVAEVRKYVRPGTPIYLGEYGFPQDEASMSGFSVAGFLSRIDSVCDSLGVTLAVWWQSLDNEEQNPGVPRGYGLWNRNGSSSTVGTRNAAGDWFAT